jgi:hypothetical protein
MSYPFCSLCLQEQSGKAKSCEIVALRAGGAQGEAIPSINNHKSSIQRGQGYGIKKNR